METVYRICSEDVLSFVKNKENGGLIMNTVRRTFTCMDELESFVEAVECELNEKKHDKFSLIEIKLNRLHLVRDYPNVLTLEHGDMLLVLETEYHLLHISMEENWSGKFLSFDFYRKDYFSSDDYKLYNILSDALIEQIEKYSFFEFSLEFFIHLFVSFLTDDREYIALKNDDESVVLVDRYMFDDYLGKDVNLGTTKALNEFKNEYTYDDVNEFLDYLVRIWNDN